MTSGVRVTQVPNRPAAKEPSNMLTWIVIAGFIILFIFLMIMIMFGFVEGGFRTFAIFFEILIFIAFIIWIIVRSYKSMKDRGRFLEGELSEGQTYILSKDECRSQTDKILFFEYGFNIDRSASPENKEIFDNVGEATKTPIYIRSVKEKYKAVVALIVVKADEVLSTGKPKLYSIIFNPKDDAEIRRLVLGLALDPPKVDEVVRIIQDRFGNVTESREIRASPKRIEKQPGRTMNFDAEEEEIK